MRRGVAHLSSTKASLFLVLERKSWRASIRKPERYLSFRTRSWTCSIGSCRVWRAACTPLELKSNARCAPGRRASRSQRNVERSTGSSAEGTRLKGVRASSGRARVQRKAGVKRTGKLRYEDAVYTPVIPEVARCPKVPSRRPAATHY